MVLLQQAFVHSCPYHAYTQLYREHCCRNPYHTVVHNNTSLYTTVAYSELRTKCTYNHQCNYYDVYGVARSVGGHTACGIRHMALVCIPVYGIPDMLYGAVQLYCERSGSRVQLTDACICTVHVYIYELLCVYITITEKPCG